MAIALYTNVQGYSIDSIFQPLLEELREFATDGCLIGTTNGYEYTLYGALIAYVADTPASQDSAVFKEGVPGPHQPCRFCETTPDLMQLYFQENDFRICYLERAPLFMQGDK